MKLWPAQPDVIVVGLGPAGSRAAAAAAAAGLTVLAIDRRTTAGWPVQCAELVPRMLDQELPDLAPVTMQTTSRMLTRVDAAAADETAPFPGRMLDRAAFDAWLVRAACDAGAICRFATPLGGVDPDGSVRINDVSFRPRLLIGADGPRSRVGAAIGRVNTDFVEARQITVDLPEPQDATDIFLSAAYPGGYGWLFPKGRVGNLGIGVNQASRGSLKLLLQALHDRLAAQGRVGGIIRAMTGGPIAVSGRLHPVGALGGVQVLLVGDAAGLTHPISGAGIASAVQSGALAGAAAAAWLGGRAGALLDYAEEQADLFDASLSRALHRRRELAASGADAAALRRAWIAYDAYWAELSP